MAASTSAASAAAAAVAPRKLRIMALHGYTSNAFMLQKRLGAIRKACRDVADFVVINGPLRVEPITSSTAEDLDAPDRMSAADDPSIPLEEQPRAWWRASDDGTYQQFDESVDFLCEEVRKQGPFDGVLGFSQGACLAALVASAFEDPSRYPRFKEGLPQEQKALRFCIAVSGFRARDEKLQGLFPSSGIQTPILHVLGKADQIVDAERSQTLVDIAPHSRVEHHESGHVIPGQAPWRNFFRDFLATFQSEPYTSNEEWKKVTGPSQRPKGEHSEPNSGTTTPRRTEATEGSQEGGNGKSSL